MFCRKQTHHIHTYIQLYWYSSATRKTTNSSETHLRLVLNVLEAWWPMYQPTRAEVKVAEVCASQQHIVGEQWSHVLHNGILEDRQSIVQSLHFYNQRIKKTLIQAKKSSLTLTWFEHTTNTQPSDLESDALPLCHRVNQLHTAQVSTLKEWIFICKFSAFGGTTQSALIQS